MKKLLLLLASIGLIGCSTISEDTLIQNVAKTNVKPIFTLDGARVCSSVLLTHNGKIRHVTNAHCCDVGIIYYEGVATEQVKKNPSVDLCELKHSRLPKDGIKLSENNPQIGSKVYIVGFPMYHDFSISFGRITSNKTTNIIPMMELPIIMTNAFTYYGNSGGAALNEKGELVGITAITVPGVWIGGFVPVDVLKSFLDN